MAGLPEECEFRKSQFKIAPVIVNLSGASTASTLLPTGMYLLYADTACYFLQGTSAVTATTSSIPLALGVYFGPMWVTGAADGYVAAIGTSGKLYLIPTV